MPNNWIASLSVVSETAMMWSAVLAARRIATGKKKRLGKFLGRKSDWKKAIVKLREGDRIEFFEGV
jgi:ribosomal protein L23